LFRNSGSDSASMSFAMRSDSGTVTSRRVPSAANSLRAKTGSFFRVTGERSVRCSRSTCSSSDLGEPRPDLHPAGVRREKKRNQSPLRADRESFPTCFSKSASMTRRVRSRQAASGPPLLESFDVRVGEQQRVTRNLGFARLV